MDIWKTIKSTATALGAVILSACGSASNDNTNPGNSEITPTIQPNTQFEGDCDSVQYDDSFLPPSLRPPEQTSYSPLPLTNTGAIIGCAKYYIDENQEPEIQSYNNSFRAAQDHTQFELADNVSFTIFELGDYARFYQELPETSASVEMTFAGEGLVIDMPNGSVKSSGTVGNTNQNSRDGGNISINAHLIDMDRVIGNNNVLTGDVVEVNKLGGYDQTNNLVIANVSARVKSTTEGNLVMAPELRIGVAEDDIRDNHVQTAFFRGTARVSGDITSHDSFIGYSADLAAANISVTRVSPNKIDGEPQIKLTADFGIEVDTPVFGHPILNGNNVTINGQVGCDVTAIAQEFTARTATGDLYTLNNVASDNLPGCISNEQKDTYLACDQYAHTETPALWDPNFCDTLRP